jgi:predicted O-methyltransferase YrrM
VWLYERQNQDKPWLTGEATKLLSSLLRPDDVGLEWGSGRSTVWFAKRVKHLTSMEDDAAWYEMVRERLAQAKLDNVTYMLSNTVSPDPATSEYVRIADRFADGSLGFALVDGNISRDLCAEAAIPKIAPGGLLVIDNANWYLDHPTHSPNARYGKGPLNETWKRVQNKLTNWRMIWTSTGCSDTAIWIRPT